MRKRIPLSLRAVILLVPFMLAFSAQEDCDNCIAVYGDSQVGHETHELVVASIMGFSPVAVFHTGDMVEDGLDEGLWETFKGITSTLRDNAEFYPAFGNHEQHSEQFFANFPYLDGQHWYSRQFYGLTFIVLDSTSEIGPGSQQRDWLESELERAKSDDEPVVVFLHYPLFNIGSHASEASRMRPLLAPLFEKYGVVAVFSGHDHNYQRFVYHKINYFVNGRGGGRLYERTTTDPANKKFIKEYGFCTISIKGYELIVRAYDQDGNLLDEASVSLTGEPMNADSHVTVAQ